MTQPKIKVPQGMPQPKDVIYYRLNKAKVTNPAQLLDIVAFFIAGQIAIDEKAEPEFLRSPIAQFYDKWEPEDGKIQEEQTTSQENSES